MKLSFVKDTSQERPHMKSCESIITFQKKLFQYQYISKFNWKLFELKYIKHIMYM